MIWYNLPDLLTLAFPPIYFHNCSLRKKREKANSANDDIPSRLKQLSVESFKVFHT